MARRNFIEAEGPLLLEVPEEQRFDLARARTVRDKAAAWLAKRKGFLKQLTEDAKWKPEETEGFLMAALRKSRDCRAMAEARRLLQFARLVKRLEQHVAPPHRRTASSTTQPSPLRLEP